jgi:hypothetical protein
LPDFDPETQQQLSGGSSYASKALQEDYFAPKSLICRDTTFVFLLSKKDFAGVIYQRRMQEQQQWGEFLAKMPLIQSLPYYLMQDMKALLYQQIYMRDEVVIEAFQP